MKYALVLMASASMIFSACSSPSPSPQVNPGSSALSTAQTGSLKARIVLPYTVQTTSRVSQAGYQLLAFVVGQEAQAQEAAPAPLTEAQLNNLTATVDGQSVAVDVTSVSSSAGETVVEVTAAAVPVGDGPEVLEVSASSGGSVGGAIVEVSASTTTTTDVTPETTAVLETALEKHGGEKIGDMTAEQLAALKVDPAVLNKAAAIRSIMKKDGTFKSSLARRFKDKKKGKPEDVKAKAEEAKAKAEETKSKAEAASAKGKEKAEAAKSKAAG